jgi:hypothetical protein
MKSDLVFRKPLLCGLSAIVIAGIFAAFLVMIISKLRASDFAGAVIFSGFVYFFWLIGWQSAVRVVKSGIIVDNLFGRNYIPWRDVAEIKGDNGLLIVTRSAGRVGSLMYGESLIGTFTGSRQSRAVAIKLKEAQQRAAAAEESAVDEDDQEYRSSVRFQAWPFLASLAAMELITGVAYALH